jgi:hypothetical protein
MRVPSLTVDIDTLTGVVEVSSRHGVDNSTAANLILEAGIRFRQDHAGEVTDPVECRLPAARVAGELQFRIRPEPAAIVVAMRERLEAGGTPAKFSRAMVLRALLADGLRALARSGV